MSRAFVLAEHVRRRQQVERARRARSCRPRGRSPCRSLRGWRGTCRRSARRSGSSARRRSRGRSSRCRNCVGNHERVGAVDAGEHRRVLHHGQHFVRHLARRSRSRCRTPAARRASRARPCGSGRSCRSRSGRCRRPPRTWPTARCRRRRRRSAGRAAILARKRVEDVCAGDAGHGVFVVVSAARAWRQRRRRDTSRHAADQRIGEGFVVDVQRQADQHAPSGRRESAARCVSNSARSASGSWNGWPGASIADTPPSGMQEAHRARSSR